MKQGEKLNNLTDVGQLSVEITDYLKTVGDNFKVFDKQDSGCISYGVEIEQGRFFVKYSEKADAVRHLSDSINFFQAISHPNIPKLLNHFKTPSGLALVFEWVDGEVLGSPDFFGREGRNNPLSPNYRFRQLPASQIIKALDIVYEAHAHLEEKGYVASGKSD